MKSKLPIMLAAATTSFLSCSGESGPELSQTPETSYQVNAPSERQVNPTEDGPPTTSSDLGEIAVGSYYFDTGWDWTTGPEGNCGTDMYTVVDSGGRVETVAWGGAGTNCDPGTYVTNDAEGFNQAARQNLSEWFSLINDSLSAVQANGAEISLGRAANSEWVTQVGYVEIGNDGESSLIPSVRQDHCLLKESTKLRYFGDVKDPQGDQGLSVFLVTDERRDGTPCDAGNVVVLPSRNGLSDPVTDRSVA